MRVAARLAHHLGHYSVYRCQHIAPVAPADRAAPIDQIVALLAVAVYHPPCHSSPQHSPLTAMNVRLTDQTQVSNHIAKNGRTEPPMAKSHQGALLRLPKDNDAQHRLSVSLKNLTPRENVSFLTYLRYEPT